MRAAVLLGVLLGAVVVCDPFVTAYLMRGDYTSKIPFRDLPYLISILTVAAIGAVLAVRMYTPEVAALMSYGYTRYFPLLFLVAYQFNSIRSGPVDTTMVAILLFMMMFVAGIFIRGDQQRFISSPINVLNAALIMCMILSLVAEFRVYNLLKSMKPFVVFFLLINCLPREDLVLRFFRWLLVLAILAAIFGIVQEVAWLGFEQLLTLLDQQLLERMFESHFGRDIFRVPAMTIGYRVLALYLAVALMLILSSLLWRVDRPLLPRRWAIFGLIVIVPGLLLTLAKDIFIGVVLGIALLLLLHRPSRLMHMTVAALAGVMALAILVAAVPGRLDRVLDIADEVPKSEYERIALDRDSIEGIIHGPYAWLGRGVGAGVKYTLHPRRWAAHNAFILVTAELGVVGLIVYSMIWLWAFGRAIALNIRVRDGPYLPVVRAMLPCLVVALVGAQFESSYLDIFVWTLFATIEAMWFQLRAYAPAGSMAQAPSAQPA